MPYSSALGGLGTDHQDDKFRAPACITIESKDGPPFDVGGLDIRLRDEVRAYFIYNQSQSDNAWIGCQVKFRQKPCPYGPREPGPWRVVTFKLFHNTFAIEHAKGRINTETFDSGYGKDNPTHKITFHLDPEREIDMRGLTDYDEFTSEACYDYNCFTQVRNVTSIACYVREQSREEDIKKEEVDDGSISEDGSEAFHI